MMKRLKVKKLLPKMGLFTIPQQTSDPNIFMPVQMLKVNDHVYPIKNICLCVCVCVCVCLCVCDKIST